MTNFQNSILGASEQMTNPHYSHLIHDNFYNFFLVFSLPRGRKRRKYTPALLPTHLTCGVRLGVQLAGSSLGFRLCYARAGAGSRGQPVCMTKYLSHVLRSMSPGNSFKNLVLTYIKQLVPHWAISPRHFPSSPFHDHFPKPTTLSSYDTNTPIVFHLL